MTSRSQGFRRDDKCFIICEGQEVEVSEPVYQTVMRDVWREEKRRQRAWRCRDGKGCRCNGNCEHCELYRLGEGPNGSDVSLDQLHEESDYEPQGSEGFEEDVVLKITVNSLITEISETVPDAARIVKMLEYEELEKDVAVELGIAKTTLNYRKNKVIAFLKDHLKDYR